MLLNVKCAYCNHDMPRYLSSCPNCGRMLRRVSAQVLLLRVGCVLIAGAGIFVAYKFNDPMGYAVAMVFILLFFMLLFLKRVM